MNGLFEIIYLAIYKRPKRHEGVELAISPNSEDLFVSSRYVFWVVKRKNRPARSEVPKIALLAQSRKIKIDS